MICNDAVLRNVVIEGLITVVGMGMIRSYHFHFHIYCRVLGNS